MNRDTTFRRPAVGYLSAVLFVSLSINIVGVAYFAGGPQSASYATLSLMVLGSFIWAFFPLLLLDKSEAAADAWQAIYRAQQKEQQSTAVCTCGAC